MPLLIKILIVGTLVTALTLLAQRLGPKWSGLVSGYPLGTALVLFFYGYELGPQFAATSALYSALGLVASQISIYAYFRVSKIVTRLVILSSVAAAMVAYLLVMTALSQINISLAWVAMISGLSIATFFLVFKSIPDNKIANTAQLSIALILLRSIIAALVVVAFTGLASSIGPVLAGLLAAFPVVLLPLVAVVHFSYGVGHAHTVIKHFPLGAGALLLYTCSVHLVYPRTGIVGGTVISFLLASVYLLGAYFFLKRTTEILSKQGE